MQRQEAEERRAKIAAERIATGETWEKLEEGKDIRGPPNPLNEGLLVPEVENEESNVEKAAASGYPGSPSPVDVRDVVAGEPSGTHGHEAQASEVRFIP